MGLLAKLADRSAEMVEHAAEVVGTALANAAEGVRPDDPHPVKSLLDGGKQAVSRATDSSVAVAGEAVVAASQLWGRAGGIISKATEHTKEVAGELVDSTSESLLKPRRASRKTALVVGISLVAAGACVGAAVWRKRKAAAHRHEPDEDAEALDLGDLSDLADDSEASQDSIAEAEADAEDADEAAGGPPADLDRE